MFKINCLFPFRLEVLFFPRWTPIQSCLNKVSRFSNLSYSHQSRLGNQKKITENKDIFVWFLKWWLVEMWCDKMAQNGQKRQKMAKWQLGCPISPSGIVLKIIQGWFCFQWFFWIFWAYVGDYATGLKIDYFFQAWLYRQPSWICLYLKFPRHEFAWICFGGYIDPNEGLGAKIGEIVKNSYTMTIMSGLFASHSIKQLMLDSEYCCLNYIDTYMEQFETPSLCSLLHRCILPADYLQITCRDNTLYIGSKSGMEWGWYFGICHIQQYSSMGVMEFL